MFFILSLDICLASFLLFNIGWGAGGIKTLFLATESDSRRFSLGFAAISHCHVVALVPSPARLQSR